MSQLEIQVGDHGLQLEVEERDDENGMPRIVGYAAVYDQLSDPLPFREVIKPGAFDRTLAEGADVRALIDHDAGRVIGRSKSTTLTMESDARGLKVRIDPPNNTQGRALVESIRRGDLDGMSFGFMTRSDQWRVDDGEEIRELLDVDLFDVSVVAFPAYPQTEAGLRSRAAWRKSLIHDKRIAARLRTMTLIADQYNAGGSVDN